MAEARDPTYCYYAGSGTTDSIRADINRLTLEKNQLLLAKAQLLGN